MSSFEALFPNGGVRDLVFATVSGIGVAFIALIFLRMDPGPPLGTLHQPSAMSPAVLQDVANLEIAFQNFGFDAPDGEGGGVARLPESHPMSVFQLNPSSRQETIDSTPGDDYYIGAFGSSISAKDREGFRAQLPRAQDVQFLWGDAGLIDVLWGDAGLIDVLWGDAGLIDVPKELHVLVPGNLWFDQANGLDFNIRSDFYSTIVIWVTGNIYIETSIIAEQFNLVLVAQNRLDDIGVLAAGGDIFVVGSPNAEDSRRLDVDLIATGITYFR